MPVVIDEVQVSPNGSFNGPGGHAPDDIDLIHLSHFALKVNGSQPSSDILDSALEFMVENSLHLPDMCIMRFQAWDHLTGQFPAWVDDNTFDIGADISVDASGEGDSAAPIFRGEVTAIEMDFSAIAVPTMIVRALSRSHRLHMNRQRRSFVNVTDSDIVSQLAGEAGLTADATSTSVVHDWVFQNNQTDWEFLQERARRNSFLLYAWDRTLKFKKVGDHTSADVSVEWGNSLRSFRTRLNAGQQVSQVTVRGWDRKTKQAIVGQQSTPLGTPQIGAPSATSAAQKFSGTAKMTVVDKPIFSQAEADLLAQSVFDDIGGEYVEADGLTNGTPALMAGKTVEIKGVGNRFSGKYYVSSSTHTYNAAEGYTTQFAITGKRPGNLLALLEDDGNAQRTQMGDNIVIGLVTQIEDHDNLGRVKVKYPWNTEDHESDWAPVAMPMAGAGRGFQYIPEVDDEVLVAFEHGDVRRPYIIGALWNGKDAPPMNSGDYVKDGKIVKRMIKTRIGHMMLFDDTDDMGEIRLTTKSGHYITLNDKGKKIEAKTQDGHCITLDDQNGKIVVVDKTGSNKMTITSSDNSIASECAGNYSVTSQGKVTISGQTGIELSTPAQMKASASAGMEMTTPAQMKIHADANMDISASGPTSVSGAIVKIN